MVEKMIVAKTHRGRRQRGQIGKDRECLIERSRAKYEIVRALVHHDVEVMRREGADEVSGYQDHPPGMTGHGGGNGELAADDGRRKPRRSRIGSEEPLDLRLFTQDCRASFAMKAAFVHGAIPV